MHYAVHGHTAAELIYERADAEKPHMGLTSWASGSGRKNRQERRQYCQELFAGTGAAFLERIVSAYLDLAEDRAERHIPMTMEDWSRRLDQHAI